jgi:hypothetical protein
MTNPSHSGKNQTGTHDFISSSLTQPCCFCYFANIACSFSTANGGPSTT